MSKYSGALGKLQAAQPAPATGGPENLNSSIPENRSSGDPDVEGPHAVETGPEREKYSTYLDRTLVTRLKVHAAMNRMKHHQVIEAALRAYLDAQP